MAVCATSSIWDKVAVGVTNNPIYFHRLVQKERWNQQTRKWKISGQQNEGREEWCLSFAVAVTSARGWASCLWEVRKSCIVFSSSVCYLSYLTLHIETTDHPIFRESFIHIVRQYSGTCAWHCNRETACFSGYEFATFTFTFHFSPLNTLYMFLNFILMLYDLHPYQYKLLGWSNQEE
jgi:hypothetical protein